MAGAWQLETPPIAHMFMQGFLSGQARADRARELDAAARDLEIERARQDDARGRATLESQRTERAAQAHAQAQQQTLASLIGPDFAALGPDLGVRLHEQQAKSQTDQAQRKTQAQYNLARALQANAGNPQVSAALRAQAQQMGIDLGGQRVQIDGEQSIAVPAGADELRGIEAMAAATPGVKTDQAPESPWEKPNTDQLDYAKILEAKGLNSSDPKNWSGYESWLAKMANLKKPPPINLGGTGSVASDLRREFDSLPEVKDLKFSASMYRKIQSSSANNTGDLGLLYAYMKLIDPGARVTEGDFANAEQLGNIPQKIIGTYNKLLGGKGSLDPALRAQFIEEASRLYQSNVDAYGSAASQYRRMAQEAGVNPDNVVLPTGIDKIKKQGTNSAAAEEFDSYMGKKNP